jgi:hypothetical protein
LSKDDDFGQMLIRKNGYFEVVLWFKCNKCEVADKRKFASTYNPQVDWIIRSKTNWKDDLNMKLDNPLND